MDISPPVGRVYRMRLWWRCFTVAYLASGLIFLGSVIGRAFTGAKPPTFGDIAGSTFLSLVALGLVGHALTSALSFGDDSVELGSVFRSRSLPLSAIRGRREYVSQGTRSRTRYIKLESDDDRFPSLDIAKSYYTFDQRFWAWFNSLRDVDAADKGSNFGLV